MAKEEDIDFEDELDELEDEIEEEEQKKVKKKVPVRKGVKRPMPQETEEEPSERYVAIYQPEKIGIADTITGEVLIEGISDVPTAQIEAMKLNKLDRIEIASGA